MFMPLGGMPIGKVVYNRHRTVFSISHKAAWNTGERKRPVNPYAPAVWRGNCIKTGDRVALRTDLSPEIINIGEFMRERESNNRAK
jgi:hypothetical protein